MKRTYIKPEMELLDSEFSTILCNSSYNWNIDGPGGGQGQPTPDGARTEDPFFDDEEEF